MCPRYGFWYRRSVLCTLVPDFGTIVRFLYPRSGFWGPGTSAKTTLMETTFNGPLCEPPKY